MAAAESLFDEIYTVGHARIDQFVKEAQEENLHIDFKEKENAANGRAGGADQKNYSKALSGFANADGGLLVWGVEARKDKQSDLDAAVSLKPIRSHRAFLGELNSLASRLVVSAVDGVRNLAIDDPGDNDQGFVVSLVPASDLAPHRAEAHGTKNYYQRVGDSFVQMEHYQLEDMFGRRRRAKLEVLCRFDPAQERGGAIVALWMRIFVRNSGRHFAEGSPSTSLAMERSEPLTDGSPLVRPSH